MKRTLVTAAVAASFAVTLLGATGASAAPLHEDNAQHGHATVVEPRSIGQCTGGRICAWANADYSGNWSSIIAQFPGQCQPVPSGGRSYYNNSAYTERVWSGSNCTGSSYIVYPGIDIPENGWVVHSIGGYP
jgi:Peptidase inhibitor family I36